MRGELERDDLAVDEDRQNLTAEREKVLGRRRIEP